MTDIRSLYLDAFRRVLAPVTEPACCEECAHDPIVHGYLKPEDLVDALADAGLLPTSVEGRYIGRGMLRRTRLVTDWKEPEQ
ncbi:hypothetical protein ACWDSF_06170 [Nocardia beijingensis]